MYFFFTEKWREKGKLLFFYVIFFKQGYLLYCIRYRSKILYASSLYPSRGKRVSDFLFRP